MVPVASFTSLLMLPGVCADSGERCLFWARSRDLSLARSRDLSLARSRGLSLARSRDLSRAHLRDLSFARFSLLTAPIASSCACLRSRLWSSWLADVASLLATFDGLQRLI